MNERTMIQDLKPPMAARLGFGELRQFALLGLQLALLFLVLRQFQIESAAFVRLSALAFGGFAVHYFLPAPARIYFFAALSIGSLFMVFGVAAALWLVAIGMTLIAICHLPLSLKLRVALLLAAGGALAIFRLGWLSTPWSVAIWPILGSMFMFRLLIYVYDLQHDAEPKSWARACGYFFMLPNVCFPMFPVVDYKNFRRNYFADNDFSKYQEGIRWITRGVVQLILYRIVYYYFTLSQTEVTNLGDLLQFIITNFLLYLRISGQFHVIVGMLHLFGFKLPETHHSYFLSASFTDFWRRINIYWKDFMMKLFYYPIYFRLKALGPTQALILSTLLVFFATWVLHAYQWFWLRGSVLFTGPDILFWSVLAVFVVVNSLNEIKHGRERTIGGYKFDLPTTLKRSTKTFLTFMTICALWSLWTSESIADWLELWGSAASVDGTGLATLLSTFLLIALGAEASHYYERTTKLNRNPRADYRSAAINCALLAGIAALGVQTIQLQLGPQAATFLNSLKSGSLSRLDVAMLEKGYYENLNRVERFNSQLWELYMNRPSSWLDVVGTGLDRFTGDFRYKELVPSFVSMSKHGKVSTNRWGMRDQDYAKAADAQTFRIALLGASSVMGWGVADGETFEALVERRLNAEKAGRPFGKYEILNLAVPGYQPLHQLPMLDKAFTFQPQAVMYVATGREASRAVSALVGAAIGQVPIPYAELRAWVQEAAVSADTSENIALRRLLPFKEKLLAWTYGKIVEDCRQRNIIPLYVFLPQVNEGQWVEETPEILKIARQAGFTILDLSDVYQGRDIHALRLAEWDNHPNSNAHGVVAQRLYQLIERHQSEIFQTHNMTAAKAN